METPTTADKKFALFSSAAQFTHEFKVSRVYFPYFFFQNLTYTCDYIRVHLCMYMCVKM